MFSTSIISVWACLVLLLSALHVSAGFAAARVNTPALAPRQSPSASTDSTDTSSNAPICQNYATVANLTTISANSTYRAAYLRSAPFGTTQSRGILDTPVPKLPALTADAALNQQCGNLTTIALTEAANNFTNGMVAQFVIQPLVGPPLDTIITPVVCGAILVLFGVTFVSL